VENAPAFSSKINLAQADRFGFSLRRNQQRPMKTEITAHVGKHAFEIAGLGEGPFRYIGMSENVITYPDGTQKAGGSCDYCGTGIRFECVIVSKDGKRSKVGCECIRKVGDAGLLKAYKSSPEFRAHQRKLRIQKAAAVCAQINLILEANRATLESQPHPRGFIDRQTGVALTAWDDAQWLLSRCGDAGRARLLRSLKAKFAA